MITVGMPTAPPSVARSSTHSSAPAETHSTRPSAARTSTAGERRAAMRELRITLSRSPRAICGACSRTSCASSRSNAPRDPSRTSRTPPQYDEPIRSAARSSSTHAIGR